MALDGTTVSVIVPGFPHVTDSGDWLAPGWGNGAGVTVRVPVEAFGIPGSGEMVYVIVRVDCWPVCDCGGSETVRVSAVRALQVDAALEEVPVGVLMADADEV